MGLVRLNAATLREANAGVERPAYDRASTRIGIVHFGPGAFHRAHQADYIDQLLGADPRWAISAVSLRSASVREALAPQDCLYTRVELGSEVRYRVIGAIREVLTAPEQPQAVLARLSAPQTRFVTLTVTEAGYCLDAGSRLDVSHPDIAHDLTQPQAPRSALGWLTNGLRARRAAGVPPFIVLSCDNLPANGPTLHAALTDFAGRIDSELARWIETQVVCPRTMVDSITPATDAPLRAQVAAAVGLQDAWPVQREAFRQWVIEDLPAVRELDWRSIGVTLAADVALYERAKLRLLNGAHSTLAYAGLLRNHITVREAMADRDLAGFVERLMREDIAASLNPSGGFDTGGYIDALLTRFRNPGLKHQLAQIAWDGSKKLPARLGAVFEEALAAGRPLHRLTVPLAAWMRFIARQARAGVPIVDPQAGTLASLGAACRGVAEADVERFLSLGGMLSAELRASASFKSALIHAYGELGGGGLPL